jgi:hypothetical protein
LNHVFFHEAVIDKFLELWDQLSASDLLPDTEDVIKWAWTDSGLYSAKPAYGAFFVAKQRASYTDFI